MLDHRGTARPICQMEYATRQTILPPRIMKQIYKPKKKQNKWNRRFSQIHPTLIPTRASLPEEENALAKCGAFCKYLSAGRGFPGEYVYHCSAPGNRHIILFPVYKSSRRRNENDPLFKKCLILLNISSSKSVK